MRRTVWTLVIVSALTACGSSGDSTTTEPTPPSSAPPTSAPPPPSSAAPTGPEAVRGVMHGHYTRALSAHDALIRADIEQARQDMNWLATHLEGSALPENLQPLFHAMQDEASHFADATTLSEAGVSFARTLQRCGACHTAANDGPELAEAPIPEGDSPDARMRRHQWASDRMFDGLVLNDPAIFREGNEALSSAPLTQAELPQTEGQSAEQVEALTTNVRTLGERAAEASDDAARAEIYGHYLATCGTCHRLLEGGIPEGLRTPRVPAGMPAPTDGDAPAAPEAPPAPAPAAPQ